MAWYKYIFFRKFPLQVFKVKRNTKNWWQNAITVKIDISISVEQKGEFSCLDIGLFLGNVKSLGNWKNFIWWSISIRPSIGYLFLEGPFSATFKLFGVGNKIYSILRRTMIAYEIVVYLSVKLLLFICRVGGVVFLNSKFSLGVEKCGKWRQSWLSVVLQHQTP